MVLTQMLFLCAINTVQGELYVLENTVILKVKFSFIQFFNEWATNMKDLIMCNTFILFLTAM